jgi:hypothetical protein
MMRANDTIPFLLRKPWKAEASGDLLEAELARELRSDGLLYGKTVRAVAQRIDCDDVLFLVDGADHKVAVVHLTWSGSTDSNKGWPTTTLYADLETWKTECMVPMPTNMENEAQPSPPPYSSPAAGSESGEA